MASSSKLKPTEELSPPQLPAKTFDFFCTKCRNTEHEGDIVLYDPSQMEPGQQFVGYASCARCGYSGFVYDHKYTYQELTDLHNQWHRYAVNVLSRL